MQIIAEGRKQCYYKVRLISNLALSDFSKEQEEKEHYSYYLKVLVEEYYPNDTTEVRCGKNYILSFLQLTLYQSKLK
jgi:hypothetical protein